ncbi:hypothetical protein P8918_13790 [Bacillus spizizenii]|nr:hypothetical protein [Bacillus spizizenii]
MTQARNRPAPLTIKEELNTTEDFDPTYDEGGFDLDPACDY